MIGQTISHYKILDKLGEGGMGVVYRAHDTRLDRFVALKFLPPHLSASEQEKTRFIQEAKAASALNHPNICTVYEIDETDTGQLYMVMAYYEGDTLESKIRDTQNISDIKTLIDWGSQIAEGLHAAHRKGIVHRDIKSSNIMITQEGRAVIMDFGLAKHAAGLKLTRTGTTVGTVPYMSPEQARGDSVDHRSDIWSLGVVLYEMIAGRLPFASEYSQAVIYSILNEEPSSLVSVRSEVPVELENIVKRMLTKNPEERYQSVEEMLLDLQVLREPVSGISIPLLVRKGFIRNRRSVIVGAALVLLVVLTAIFASLWLSEPPSITSISVLPLANLSGNPDQDYLASGIHEDLIVELSKLTGLRRVIARASVMRYANTAKSLTEIGRELGVDAIITGSVIRVADRVRVTVQLIESETERQVWADRYESELRDVLTLQNEIVTSIAERIQLQLTPEEHIRLATARQVHPDAYDAYLRGTYQWHKLTSQDLEIALRYFELARAIDPNYPLAYAGIATVWMGRQQNGFASTAEALPNIRSAATRALELDNTLADIHFLLAVMKVWCDWDWIGADSSFRRAIELNPGNAKGRAYYSHLLQMLGKHNDGILQIEHALELDPFNSLYRGLYGMNLLYARQYDEAIKVLNEILKDVPEDPIALSTLRSVYHMKGMYEEALDIWRNSYAARGDIEIVEAFGHGSSETDYRAALTRVVGILTARMDTAFVTPWQIGTLYARAGQKSLALEWLEKAFEIRDPNIPYLSIDPIFDELRGEQRFRTLLERMNAPGI
jgi:serine/threonine protein kinase/tetratricopeptide (TPR) repeat protein